MYSNFRLVANVYTRHNIPYFGMANLIRNVTILSNKALNEAAGVSVNIIPVVQYGLLINVQSLLRVSLPASTAGRHLGITLLTGV